MKKCLIIEDSETIREIVSRMVSSLGLTPIEVETVGAGLSAYEEAKPDVVMLDWDLPSLAALDFLKKYNEFETDQKAPIILCATENDAQQFALAKAAGAEHHLLKPFDQFAIAQKFAELGFGDDDFDADGNETDAETQNVSTNG